MTHKIVFLALSVTFFALCSFAPAQQWAKMPRIGWLGVGSEPSTGLESLRRELGKLGYVEGKNMAFESRYAHNELARLPALADELVRLNVDVVLTTGTPEALALKNATRTIPIIFLAVTDPVAAGLVDSLARPGGNITGLSQLSPELAGKRLEILKEVLPKLSRVAVFWTSTSVGNAQVLKEIEPAAAVLGVKLQYLDVFTTKDIEPAFRVAVKGRADAVLENIAGNIRGAARKDLAELAIKHRLLVMRERPEHVEAGGLMSYGVNLRDLDRRFATYVDKILKGAKPSDLPVKQPMKFEFVINLKAAKQIGLTIPPNVLARADRVIR